MTDQELIEGIKQQDRNAFRFLVGQHQRLVIKTAYYFVGDMDEAEDISQEVFMQIIDSIGRFRGSSTFTTWIYRITVNKSLTRVKRNKRREIFTRLESLFRPGASTPNLQEPADESDPVEKPENKELLNRAIASLPDNQRTAFILSKYEELSYKEIAGIMELSLNAVESLIHRAKINLQKSLSAHFPEYVKT
jgi:RNA polymerase sigma-70 factor (ECF subfamily)